MKVVLFCGGLGMRLREQADNVPKPMVNIGYRPILWHVMKYYAQHGHKDFVLCLGYRSDAIKDYFLNYNEAYSNDFVLTNGGRNVTLLNSDVQDWRITFADTGVGASVGQRLKAVQRYLEDEPVFLANYADGLTDLALPDMLRDFQRREKIACFLSVRPAQTFHVVAVDDTGLVQEITPASRSDVWTNGGYFIFRREIFEYLRPGEDLVEEPFQRLIQDQQLVAYKYDGFWTCMDTFKEKERLEDMCARGEMPWARGEAPQSQGLPAR